MNAQTPQEIALSSILGYVFDLQKRVADLEKTVSVLRKQPEIIHSHGKIWMRHYPGDPAPVADNARIYVLDASGEERYVFRDEVYELDWDKPIIGWRFDDSFGGSGTYTIDIHKKREQQKPNENGAP